MSKGENKVHWLNLWIICIFYPHWNPSLISMMNSFSNIIRWLYNFSTFTWLRNYLEKFMYMFRSHYRFLIRKKLSASLHIFDLYTLWGLLYISYFRFKNTLKHLNFSIYPHFGIPFRFLACLQCRSIFQVYLLSTPIELLQTCDLSKIW